ncbi:MAG: NAD(P)/FAD-dependent oxidoreductase [Nitrospirae bacterium]|nr:NAD(P)/FAD-dependent oxidoreductase [Nitrospirota bacterium]
MTKQRLVVVGNGMAALACLEEIYRRGGPPQAEFEVTVFGAEREVNYNRILLSDVLSGKKNTEEIVLNPLTWYAERGIRLHLGEPVAHLDVQNRTVRSAGGIEASYDLLLLAMGSVPFIPPIKGVEKPDVFTYRSLEDVRVIRDRANRSQNALVIGGGLRGLEAARALAELGLEVTVAHLMDRLLEMQLDGQAAAILRRQIEELGIRVLLGHCADEILGNGATEGVHFTNGTAREADLVLISTGIRPNVALAQEGGLEVRRGIVVNDFLETSVPGIYAIGECVEHRGKTYGLVAPIYEQAKTAAAALCGDQSKPYTGSVTAAKLKVAGVDVVSMGNFLADGAACEEMVYSDPTAGIYQKVVLQGGRVVGGIFLGDTALSGRIFQVLQSGEDVTLQRKGLLRGEGGVPPASVMALPDEAVICGCMGVCKGTIMAAIQEHGCTSREAIAEETRACTSCKSCGPLLDQILQQVLGGEYVKTAQQPVFCGCLPLDQTALRTEIKVRGLRSATEALRALGNGVGCAVCKPGLSYLLSEVWANDHLEERQHRFINDRVHANIQKDSSFSVVPRMYGGVTSPEELRRIADAAERYGVRMVKLTGGARIDLLGVSKADLPRIWADLGMPSGHAYAKAIRTCKSCVGTDFCRFGVQDSISMGIAVEKAFEGLYTPHKVKLSVSGCPRNCAESTVKDIGLVGIQGGWEVYVGGAAGMKVRKGDLLCTVETREEALAASAKFLQLYREEARYMERTYDYVERVGMETIQKVVLENPDEGSALLSRLNQSKALAQDPWLEREHPVHPRQFEDLIPAPAGASDESQESEVRSQGLEG